MVSCLVASSSVMISSALSLNMSCSICFLTTSSCSNSARVMRSAKHKSLPGLCTMSKSYSISIIAYLASRSVAMSCLWRSDVHAAWSVTQTQGCCSSRCRHFLAHSTPASASRSVIPYFNSALFSRLLWKAIGRSTPLSSICIRMPPNCLALQSVIMIIGFWKSGNTRQGAVHNACLMPLKLRSHASDQYGVPSFLVPLSDVRGVLSSTSNSYNGRVRVA